MIKPEENVYIMYYYVYLILISSFFFFRNFCLFYFLVWHWRYPWCTSCGGIILAKCLQMQLLYVSCCQLHLESQSQQLVPWWQWSLSYKPGKWLLWKVQPSKANSCHSNNGWLMRWYDRAGGHIILHIYPMRRIFYLPSVDMYWCKGLTI